MMSIYELFYMTNNAILRKILVIARNRSARFGVSSALGALGRRFESCRPDHLKPSHTSELPRLAFLLEKYDHTSSGQIVVKSIDSRSKIRGN